MENSNNNISTAMNDYTTAVKAPRMCKMTRDKETGYGFNLHGEKGVIGQYISAVDTGGPADLSGLCVGDRVVEVNNINVESYTHAQVVAAIKAQPGSTELLVIDKVTDNYLKSIGKACTSDLAKYKSIYDLEGQESSNPSPEKEAINNTDNESYKQDNEKENISSTIDDKKHSDIEDSLEARKSEEVPTYESIEDSTSEDSQPVIESNDKNPVDAMSDMKINDSVKPRLSQSEKSVPKRKQVKENKTDWKAKADLFNNL